jgi:hypothetical protein
LAQAGLQVITPCGHTSAIALQTLDGRRAISTLRLQLGRNFADPRPQTRLKAKIGLQRQHDCRISNQMPPDQQRSARQPRAQEDRQRSA